MRTCLILILAFTCIFSHAKAQYSPKFNTLKVSSGLYFLGSGDLLMPKIEVEYRKAFNDYFSYGIALVAGHHNENITNRTYSSYYKLPSLNTTAHIDANIFIQLPLYLERLYIGFGLGPSFMVHNEHSPYIDFYSGNPGKEFYKSTTHFSIGGQVGPELLFYTKNKKYGFNIRAIIQPYYNEDISSGVSLGFMGRW